jgi:UDP-N-acetylglucosamine 2-epimerase (non-hydrolysing)
MNKVKILIIFGTRPEAIKMAPVVKELKKHKSRIKTIVCVSGQHREMLKQVLSIFNIKPDIDLNIMQKNQSLDSLTSNAMQVLAKILTKIKPDLVLVQGDTTTAMVAGLASFYQRIPVGHIEAGLRTNDIYNPFPEEINRRIITTVATYHFAPTKNSFRALLKEGVPKKSIFLTGNTIVDAMKMIARGFDRKVNLDLGLSGKNKLILVTAHRRENFGAPLKSICAALSAIVKRNKNVEIVYPVHLNPNVREPVYRLLSGINRIHLIPPVEYHQLAYLLKKAYLVLTDSGGIQEEAPVFGKPVLVMRIETERPEGIKAGVTKLIGTDKNTIVREVELLLYNHRAYAKMSKSINLYGDGKAAKRIVCIIVKNFKKVKK